MISVVPHRKCLRHGGPSELRDACRTTTAVPPCKQIGSEVKPMVRTMMDYHIPLDKQNAVFCGPIGLLNITEGTVERAAHVCHHALRDVSSTLPLDMDSNPDFVETVRIPGSLPSTQSPNKIALTTASHAGALNPHNAPPASDTALSATKKPIIIHPITSYSYCDTYTKTELTQTKNIVD